VNIAAVDTHRPKPKTTSSGSVHLSPAGVNTNVRNTNAGASGEIVISPMSPILPISPQLFPNLHIATPSAAKGAKSVSKQSTGTYGEDEYSVPADMSSLDLGATASI
jgi:6-phosphofructo-2-kinase/fructose-2,6-biphosphatase 2